MLIRFLLTSSIWYRTASTALKYSYNIQTMVLGF